MPSTELAILPDQPNQQERSRPVVKAVRREVALALAEGKRTLNQVAADFGLYPKTITGWKKNAEFAGWIETFEREINAGLIEKGILSKQTRLDAKRQRHEYLEQIRAERAKDPELSHVPGGSTGLLTKTVRTVRVEDHKGEYVTVKDYTIDKVMLAELSALEQQVAQEKGEWLEKRDISTGGEPIRMTLSLDRPRNALDD